ncbi:Pre-mRNA-processing factor 40 B [Clonorchis sinensis]|uniref:Pre-mRNA-processing factor 40 B n=1 Tax=Clonorchis sinensis TaxID=79923 RepID=A0A8T1MQT7_CLOSI|nr:Pre-mRNA-processing factor 40 B [Clonorchis sinensis]
MAGYPPYTATFHHPYAQVAYLPAAVPTIAPVSQWIEHTSHDGRKYYYNTATQQTTWDKPQELKTTRELILSSCPWKEFKSENGRLYYFNEQTKQSVWVKPQELIDAENQAESASSTAVSDKKVPASSVLGTPCTPATPKDEPSKPPEPSAIEKAMMATLSSYDLPTTTDSIPIPPPPPTEAPAETPNEYVDRTSADNAGRAGTAGSSGGSPAPHQEYKTRGEMAEGLRRLFRDCNVPGSATWEQALKLISADPRYSLLKTFTEKKQIFNVYKTQRLKEEREEQRLRAKQAKEDLERFLLRHPKLHSTMSYRKVEQLLSDAREWTSVPDRDRRELFEDVMQLISKRERDEAKVVRKRNIKVFHEILSGMPNLTFRTTWSEAQQMLLDNPKFTGDIELQSLDKEDALICFEEHICMLEQEHDEEKERDRRRQKRQQRKNREAFIVLLDELHENKLLTATSLWKDLYSIINRDERFHKMLAQRGSTPLDLFKFYVEALKARYPAERKLIKEIIKDNGLNIDLSTSFEDFVDLVSKDERSKGIDDGNMRMTYESFLEKAQGRERERQRDDARRMRKLEQNFCEMLCSAKFIGHNTTWEEVRDHFSGHPAFCALTLESERIRLFKEYLISLESAALAESEKSRKGHKEKHRHKREVSESVDKREKNKKRVTPASPDHSDASGAHISDGDVAGGSGKRKHRKSKKSKHRKSKHRKHHKAESRQAGGEELEEGEAADDDDEGEATEEDTRHRRRKHRRRARSSDPEDGEEVDSGSEDEETYERESKRKRH